MKKLTDFELAYAALERIGLMPITDGAIAEIRRSLAGKSGLLASRAADIAASKGLRELIPDMISAFGRFMVDGLKTDKQCAAKISIANALNALEYPGDEVFLAGARCSQIEPSFGKPVDTAIKLRCACAFGLARIEHPDAHYTLADLLVDPDHTMEERRTDDIADAESEVRVAAAKALAYLGASEAEVLLRLRVLTRDKSPEVMSECFKGLLQMSPARSLDFVARYLRASENLAECAALAIGSSRVSGAYDALRKCWDDDLSPTVRRMLLLPIALTRTDDAFEFLLGVLRRADEQTASLALQALGLYADDDSLRKISEASASRRG